MAGAVVLFGRWSEYAPALTYLLSKHEASADDPAALSRIRSQVGFALAAAGQGREARSLVRRVLSQDPFNLRAWLSLAISAHLVSADTVGRVANRFGKGI